ncbi:MAG: DUF1697 domain-containing protein [Maricaulaceae bacterium]|jgi:uncharacterized protein (DUF1697 family)
MTTWIALLRAVNVGNRRVKMADLKALLADAGLAEPETHVQSGNVVFGSKIKSRDKLAKTIEDAIEAGCGFHAPAILRTAEEIAATLAANPFKEKEAPNPSWLVVQFDKIPPNAAALKSFAKTYDGPEIIRVPKPSPKAIGEAFIYYPEGIGRSNLGPALSKAKVPLPGTARNIKVVAALAEMAAARS